jgi:hypothetical protein
VSAQDQGGSPPSGGPATAQPGVAQSPPSQAGAAPAVPGAPEGGPDGAAVITSHGEAEARAYVAPIQVPKRHQRLKTMDMSKVRISDDMRKVEVLDARHMPTTRMEVPPGGLRPPPPPAAAEVGEPASSPWSQAGGIDRSLLPSASLGPASAPPGARLPAAAPVAGEDEGGRGFGIWIGVVIIAALLGGGAAFLLRNRVTPNGPSGVSSSAPIAVTVPKTSQPPSTATTGEPTAEDPAEPAPTDSASPPSAGDPSTAPPKTTTTTVGPRKTTTTKPTATSTAPAPTTTGTGPKRLFN